MNKKLLFFAATLLLSFTTTYAQCVLINCSHDIVADNDAGVCGAVVNYTNPYAEDPCTVDTIDFVYTGSIQTWTVPAGVTSITVTAKGAQGGQNTTSTTTSGLGASITGTFTVTPGMQFKILVGQQPSAGSGNGGGGGSFVTDISNNPYVIAGGGGGSSQGDDSPAKHGQAGTSGGTGAGGGGVGGTAGSGGSAGASGFQSGAGGGLLTSGADGWTSATGGSSFILGGAGGPTNAPANGGFGGGGSGSSYVVGGGGGGYSGGGSGGNTTAGVGGGGGSYNGGTSPVNTTGVNTGNGSVQIIASGTSTPITVTQIAGLPSGSFFPVGVTTNVFVANAGPGNSDTCTFTVTVNDTTPPVFSTCPLDVEGCGTIGSNIAPGTLDDNCTISAPLITYTLSGATTGSGTGDASSAAFNTGVTTVTYSGTDAAGNTNSCSFNVTIYAQPAVTGNASDTAVCVTDADVSLTGAPAGGTWTGTGVSGTSFDPSTGVGTYTLTYHFTSTDGCTDSAQVQVQVLGCAGIENTEEAGWNMYPNPAGEVVTLEFTESVTEGSIILTDMSGKVVMQKNISATNLVQLPLNGLAAGSYLLRVKTNSGDKVQTLIIK